MEKRKKGGRNKKIELKESFISFRLTEAENIELERKMSEVNIKNRSHYIKAKIFEKDIRIVKTDIGLLQYLTTLSDLQIQYRAIGNNYNQCVKAIKTAFSEKKALAFLYKMEQATRGLISVNKEIIQITKEIEEKWSQK